MPTRRLLAIGLAIAALVAIAWGVVRWRQRAAPAGAIPGPLRASWELDLERGDVVDAADGLARAVRRHPDDLALAGRDVALAIVADRGRAAARADALATRPELPALTRAAVAAAVAARRGQPVEAAAALAAPAAAVTPASIDELLLRFARAALLAEGDRADEARGEQAAILARWPAFAPAALALVDAQIERDQLDEARRVVDRFVTAAPDGPAVDRAEIELAIGERRYREAVDRLDRLAATGRGRDADASHLRGDLRLVLGDVDGALSAYDAIEDDGLRDERAAGALASAGRVAAARARLVSAMARPPAPGEPSHLDLLVVSAALLALESADAELAARAGAAIAASPDLPPPLAAARDFALGAAAALGGTAAAGAAVDAPLAVVLATRGRAGADALELLRRATAPAAIRSTALARRAYPALWLERARAAADAGQLDEALDAVDRVVQPRRIEPTRGPVLGRALALRADLLDRLHRGDEAAATRAQLEQLRARPAE